MLLHRIVVLAMSAIVALAANSAHSQEPAGKTKADQLLVGTWKFTGNSGGPTTLKHVTATHFLVLSYDKDGQVTRIHGGTYQLTGETYEEKPEHGLGNDFNFVRGKTLKFKCRLEGNKWHHAGDIDGFEINEVWERVEK